MKKLTTKDFIEKSIAIFKEEYNYDLVEYKNNKTKVRIICNICNKEFEVTPHNHIDKKSGCPNCRYNKLSNKLRLTQEEFINRCNKIHNNKYDYSLVEYINQNTKVKIICKEHGVFEQVAGFHMHGHGCSKCANEKNGINKRLTQEEFIERANQIHNNKYDYSLVEYKTSNSVLKIICRKHGMFEQIAQYHINDKNGCPKCAHLISNGEIEVKEYLDSIGVKTEHINNVYGTKLELDLYNKDFNIGIEYDGIRWHSENIAKDKYNLYNKNKVLQNINKDLKIIHIYDWEWENKKEICKDLLRLHFNVNPDRVFYARKLIIKNVGTIEAFNFLEQNHIQGGIHCPIRIGLYNKNELLALMVFKFNKQKNMWDNCRYAVKLRTGIVGGFNKLKKESGLKNIFTFIDKRWFWGTGHLDKGFKIVHETVPTFKYLVGNMMFHRQKFTFDKNKKDYIRIWDCGKILLEYKS